MAEALLETHGQHRLKTIVEASGETVTYGDACLVRAILRMKNSPKTPPAASGDAGRSDQE